MAAMEFRVARNREELEAAFALVYREYRKRGYVEGAKSGLRVILHNALPRTACFVGIDDSGRVAATATIVPDSPLGLPMDDCYRAEMDILRAKGKPCEVVMLASDFGSARGPRPRPIVPPIFSFFKVLLDYAMIVLAADYLCAAVNPRHAAAFRYILFQPLGGRRSYRSVNDAPAVAEFLDLRTLMSRLRESGHEIQNAAFGGAPTDPSRFEDKLAFGKGDLDYFFRERSEAFESASPECLEYIAGCYDGAEPPARKAEREEREP